MTQVSEPLQTLSFENAMSELETIVSRLEQADVPLEQSITLFTRGEALKARCDTLLREAEAKIEKITLDAAGKAVGVASLDPDR